MHTVTVAIEERILRRLKSAMSVLKLSGNRGGDMELLYQAIEKIFKAESDSQIELCLTKYK